MLTAAVMAVFMPALNFGFAHYDDDSQIIENPMAMSLAPANLRRMFTEFSITSYYPVRMLSYAIDFRIWGTDARGYHLTNVMVHMANVLLLFGLLLRLGPCIAGWPDRPPSKQAWWLCTSAMATALFAVHPVVIEPVAWIPGREELLMTFFILMCLHLHHSARLAAERSAGRGQIVALHILTGAAAAMAAMCNVVGVVAALLVPAYDVAFARIRGVGRIVAGSALVWAVAAGAIVLKFIGESTPPGASAADPVLAVTLADRLALVPDEFRRNLTTLVWPSDLSLLYPREVPATFFSAGPLIGIALGLVALAALWLLRRRPLPLMGLLWFLFALAPSSQVLPHQVWRADRFLYLPLAGLVLVITAGLWRLVDHGWATRAAAFLAVPVAAVLGIASAQYLPVWHDGVTLFTHCLAKNPGSAEVENALAFALLQEGRPGDAVPHFREAIRLQPTSPRAIGGLGKSLMELGNIPEAMRAFETAVGMNPYNAEAHNNLGVTLMDSGNLEYASREFQEALRLEPDSAPAYYNLGVIAFRRGNISEAAANFQRAVELNPVKAEPHNNLGVALLQLGDADGAMQQFETAVRLAPTLAEARSHLGVSLLRKGRVGDGLAQLQEAARLKPRSSEIRRNLAIAFIMAGLTLPAVQQYQEALRVNADDVEALFRLARILATTPEDGLRSGQQAVQLAKRACQLTANREPMLLDTLAAAYAETGQFDAAVQTAQRAADAAAEAGQADMAKSIREHIAQFQSGRPLREKPAP
jgi:Flp pilus assembly protein TadD